MTDDAGAVAAKRPRVESPLRVLSLLAIKSAFAERSLRNGAWELAIFAPRGAEVVLVGAAAAPVHAPAMEKGWVSETSAGKWRLTRLGRDHLRRMLSAGGGVCARSVPAAKPPECAVKPGFNGAESPLSWLRQRKTKDGQPMMTQPQFEAGERFRADFCAGHMAPRVTTNWSEPLGGRSGRRADPRSGLEFSERVSAAQERVRRALAAVGPELSGILLDVCCHLKKLEDTERACQWPQRSAKLVLLLALTSLARHYRMIEPCGHSAAIRHWGATDYQPSSTSFSSSE